MERRLGHNPSQSQQRECRHQQQRLQGKGNANLTRRGRSCRTMANSNNSIPYQQ